MRKMNKRTNAHSHFMNNYNLQKCKRALRVSNQQIMKKLIPNSKRSQGHIEMMLSFILFITAILFIFFYINPFSKTADKSNELEQIQNKIMQSISEKAGRLSVVSYSGNCYNFNELEYPSVNYVEFPESSSGGIDKYTIYFSNKFPSKINTHKDNPIGCTSYKLGVFSNETIILYDLLKDLATGCNTDAGYKDTKKNLGISLDFTLNITDMSRVPLADLNFAKRIPAGVEVQSEEFPIKIVNSNGATVDAIFNIKVW